MDIGSLVELVRDGNWSYGFIVLVKRPVKGKIYTVREIRKLSNRIGILLEEITNPIHTASNGITAEPGFVIDRFRELLPPMDIAAEIEKQEELVWI